MSLADWFEFVLINISAATAIAIDACVLVLLKFREFSKYTIALQWAGAVGLTHALFPMVGFMGGWFLIEQYNLAAVIYPVGASLLGILIYLILRESINPHLEGESIESFNLGRYSKILAFWVPVMYVSFDALLSGPGKTVLLERYPDDLAWISFLIVGLLVGLFTLIAGGLSHMIHNRSITGRLTSTVALARTATVGIIGELVLFSFFLAWSITKTVEQLPSFDQLDVPLPYVVISGLVGGGTLSGVFYHKIKLAQITNARSQWPFHDT